MEVAALCCGEKLDAVLAWAESEIEGFMRT